MFRNIAGPASDRGGADSWIGATRRESSPVKRSSAAPGILGGGGIPAAQYRKRQAEAIRDRNQQDDEMSKLVEQVGRSFRSESNIYANGVRGKNVLYDVVLGVRDERLRKLPRKAKANTFKTQTHPDVNKRAQMLGIA